MQEVRLRLRLGARLGGEPKKVKWTRDSGGPAVDIAMFVIHLYHHENSDRP